METSSRHILIIDDDVDICLLLERFLTRKGFQVSTSYQGKEGIKIIERESIDLVLTDFRLPDLDGEEILAAVKAFDTTLPVIIITGYSDVKQAVKLIQQGAFEYVTKPIFPEEIVMHITNALKDSNRAINVASVGEVNSSTKIIEKPILENKVVVGTSEQALAVEKLISLVAPTDMTVLLLGESGTGKEVAARRIHELSKRTEASFVAVDCGALPQELAASELFGHVKGAFTGAITAKKGYFELANGGTLFLDELGNLSYENQVKLLRVLQERVFKPVGGERDIPVDVRVVVATNENLTEALNKGDFREDVFYRINEFSIELAPLRERKEDLPAFLAFFLMEANAYLDKSIVGFSKEALALMNQYTWPGNFRELKNVIRRAVLLAEKDTIERTVLPNELFEDNTKQSTGGSGETRNTLILKEVVEDAEKNAIIRALETVGNNKSKCAEVLGIERKTLYNKLNAYGLL